LKTNPDGAGIVQTIGPLKSLAHKSGTVAGAPSHRYVIVTKIDDPSYVVLRQVDSASSP